MGAMGGVGGVGGVVDPCDNALRVFVTSTTTTADMTSVFQQDFECGVLAGGGNWVAWLSRPGAGNGAIDRLSGNGPWCNTAGELVFADKASVTMGVLDNPIDRDEAGNPPGSPVTVWTGTLASGGVAPNNRHCDSWTSQDLVILGRTGDYSAVDGTWTDNGDDQMCSTMRRVYCFEQ